MSHEDLEESQSQILSLLREGMSPMQVMHVLILWRYMLELEPWSRNKLINDCAAIKEGSYDT